MNVEDRKRFEQVDKRLEGMDSNITDARSHIHRINESLFALGERTGKLERDMVRHEEQTKAGFADVRKDIKHTRNYLLLAIAIATVIIACTGEASAVLSGMFPILP